MYVCFQPIAHDAYRQIIDDDETHTEIFGCKKPCFIQGCYKVENTMDLQYFLPYCNLVNRL